MTNKEIENKIKTAFSAGVPDNFDAILSSCEQPVMSST